MADLSRDPLTKESEVRPVVIVQNNKGNASSGRVIAVTITAKRKHQLPTHVSLFKRHGVKRPSIALCENIITVNKTCLLNYLGTVVNTEAEHQLNHALKISLELGE